MLTRKVLSLLCLLIISTPCLASDTSDIDHLLGALRTAARGEAPGPHGLRSWIGPSLCRNPRLLLPSLSETTLVRRLAEYSPMTPSAEDRAAAVLGLWLLEHGDTIQRAPLRISMHELEWSGSRLLLERTGSGLCLAGAVDTARAMPLRAEGALPGRRLSILSTNDMHGQLLAYDASWGSKPRIGAMASVATYVRGSRIVAAAMGHPVLLFDAGDMYQGTPEGTLSRGHAVVTVMNALNYDAITIGNHDFDHGRENAEALVRTLNAPVLGANVIDTATGRVAMGLRASKMFGDVGVVGILTSTMPSLTFAHNIHGLEFPSETETLRNEIRHLDRLGARTVIALTHAGISVDTAALANEDGVDVIVGGHSHTPLDAAYVSPNGTIVIQTGGKASAVARLDLLLRPDGSVETFAYRHVTMYADAFSADPAMVAIIDSATAPVAAEMDRVIGTAAEPIPHSYRDEAPMGRLATDLIREWASAEIAILSGGGIRAGFLEGPIRVRDCFQVFPFGNAIAVGSVPGSVLLRVLEHGVSTDRGRIQVSGIVLSVDPQRPAGSRLVKAEVAGIIVDPSRNYRVVTDAFLAQGGSGYFAGETIEWEFPPDGTAFDLLKNYVEKNRTVRPDREPRIR